MSSPEPIETARHTTKLVWLYDNQVGVVLGSWRIIPDLALSRGDKIVGRPGWGSDEHPGLKLEPLYWSPYVEEQPAPQWPD